MPVTARGSAARTRERLSSAAARRVALAAQGFADPRPAGAPDLGGFWERRASDLRTHLAVAGHISTQLPEVDQEGIAKLLDLLTFSGFRLLPQRGREGHLRWVVARTGLLQIDSVNVFERAHYLPAFSRLGPYAKDLVDAAAYRRHELFEYWGHEASLLPVDAHPLLRWRMAQAAAGEAGWGRTRRIAVERPDLVAHVLSRVAAEGPVGAGALHDGERRGGPWWGWNETKVALEHLFWSGRLTTAVRTRQFERLYDLPERVLPAAVMDAPTPLAAEAQRALVERAARAHGVATERDLRDYYRIGVGEARAAVHALAAEGVLVPVDVEGWGRPAWLHRDAVVPRRVRASALLSPFDPLVWERARTQRLFGFTYRIEIYVPAPQRVHGYYVLPFLHDEALRGRVDLKADRAAGVLRVAAAWLEPGEDAGEVAAALAGELRRAAAWQGLGQVHVADRGDLAPELRAALAP